MSAPGHGADIPTELNIHCEREDEAGYRSRGDSPFYFFELTITGCSLKKLLFKVNL